MNVEGLDVLDVKILDVLENNARATYLNIPDYFTPPVRSLGTTIPVYGYH